MDSTVSMGSPAYSTPKRTNKCTIHHLSQQSTAENTDPASSPSHPLSFPLPSISTKSFIQTSSLPSTHSNTPRLTYWARLKQHQP